MGQSPSSAYISLDMFSMGDLKWIARWGSGKRKDYQAITVQYGRRKSTTGRSLFLRVGERLPLARGHPGGGAAERRRGPLRRGAALLRALRRAAGARGGGRTFSDRRLTGPARAHHHSNSILHHHITHH